MAEIAFDKYQHRGAYHWADYDGGLLRMNAYTRARYDLVAGCLAGVGLPAEPRLLDMGCGDGALAGLLYRRFGGAITGADPDAKAIALAEEMFARRGYRAAFRQVAGTDTGLPDGNFDAVVCSDVIEHVPDPVALLREIHRVLKPGGHLVLTTPIRFSERPLDPNHVQEWFPQEFEALCRPVFDAPLAVCHSHPVFWYELITSGRPWVNRLARVTVNTLTRLGRNPFEQSDGAWRCYTTQMLLLAKAIDESQ
jgi:2-polyprenyl-3-methyl-5-hydroxy-6-metoxy-1,4-benzoquinol methylase